MAGEHEDKEQDLSVKISLLQKSIDRLATHLDKKEMQDYLDLIGKPKRLIWTNFISGMARGVGLLLGGGLVGAVALAVVVALVGILIHFLGGLPWVGQRFEDFVGYITHLVVKKH